MSKEVHRRKNARAMLGRMGYKAGGHVKAHSDEAEDKALIKKEVKKTALKGLKDGGCADGGEVNPRADRLARGGKAHHHKGKKGSHTTVNVVVAGGHQQPKPVPVPVPVPAGGAASAGPMPPPGAMPPGGPMPPDQGPPPGLKRGGRAKAPKIDNQRDMKGGMPAGHFKRGGRTKAKFPVPMDAGGGGAKGRLEKIKDYG